MATTSQRARIVGFALTLIGLHLVLLALFTQGLAVAVAAVGWFCAAPVVIGRFERGGRVERTLITGLIGLAALAGGAIAHVGHAAFNGPTAADITGILTAAAGFGLILIASEALFVHTRRRTKLLALPLAFVLLQFYVLPVLVTGTVATNASRGDGPPASSLRIVAAEDVRFASSDGVALGGWFVPGSRDAAVVLLHGSHGTRASTSAYLRFLHRAGYAVLAYDARGHGSSDGHENGFGWHGDRDLAGAVEYLRGRGIESVAALGLSMGGEEALRAAANRVGLRAVIADGAGASTLGDAKLEQDDTSPLFSAVTWLGMRTVALFSGDDEPPALADRLDRIRVPVLLIASNRRNERRIDSVFRDRIGARATLWYVADAGHTKALERHPDAYRARVLNFLADALR
jgi:uncharacterized protein